MEWIYYVNDHWVVHNHISVFDDHQKSKNRSLVNLWNIDESDVKHQKFKFKFPNSVVSEKEKKVEDDGHQVMTIAHHIYFF
jgi:phage-related protein